MRPFLPFLLSFFLLTLTPSSLVPASVNPAGLQKAMDSLVHIYFVVETDDTTGESKLHSCTGFPVGPVYYITAAHCVPDLHERVIIRHGVALSEGAVQLKDEKLDLAAVVGPEIVAGLPVGPNPLDGEPLWILGFPHDAPFPVFFEGRNMGTHETDEGRKIIINHLAFRGVSGGPVLNEKWQVVSVVQRTSEWGGIFASNKDFRGFLVRLGIMNKE